MMNEGVFKVELLIYENVMMIVVFVNFIKFILLEKFVVRC